LFQPIVRDGLTTGAKSRVVDSGTARERHSRIEDPKSKIASRGAAQAASSRKEKEMAKDEKEKKPAAAAVAAPATPAEKPAKEPAAEKPAKEAKEGGEKSGKESREPKVKVKKQKRNVPRAIAHVKSTFNNTIVTITDLNGDTLAWDSAGSMGFKGSRKGTPFAAQRAGENVADKAKKMGVREVECRVQGPGAGRDSACRALQASGIEVKSIEDVTPLPHNGCRPKKRRRV